MTDLVHQVVSPPDALRPTPLFWWSGDDLDPDKLRWQLDRLAAAGVGGTVVGYSHTITSGVDAAEPAPFSERWWEIFAEFVRDSGRRGLTVGFQEYVVLNHLLLDHPQEPPSTAATLAEQSYRVTGGQRWSVTLPHPVLCAYAFPWTEDRDGADAPLDLARAVRLDLVGASDSVDWTAPEGDWLVSVVTTTPPVLYGAPLGFDPLSAGAAEHVIANFYEVFHRRLGDLVGTTLTTFFQDELDLGIRMPMWSGSVAAEFERRKGYALGAGIVALWHDVGPTSAKLRVDYSDVVVTLLETHYFKPVHAWHQVHGTRIAMDQMSRGDLASGREHYGDYARTMRWFDAPGNDDPHLDDARNLFGFKVNSSIAHLYERPMVWNEAFYGSGWGPTPAQILAGLNEDFAYGVTHVSLHGLYHHTRAGWWEWASPDFHFRQPYWRHLDGLWPYLTRASFVLSQGAHRCDIAVLDPVTDLEATRDDPAAATAARTLIEGLVRRGRDADLVDFESLDRAETDGDALVVAGERYRVLILPSCTVVRDSTISAVERFVAAGGVVLAWGWAPEGSERDGSPTAAVIDRFAVVEKSLAARGVALVIPPDLDQLVEVVDGAMIPDVRSDDGLLCLHRALDDADLYWVTNPLGTDVVGEVVVRAVGTVTELDLFTGAQLAVPDTRVDDAVSTRIPLTVAAGAARCLMVSAAPVATAAATTAATPGNVITEVALDDPWTSTIVPTIENDYGDFAYPAGPLGVRTARVRVEECVDATPTWVERRIGDGPRLLVLGPIPADTEIEAIAARLSQRSDVEVGSVETIDGRDYRWRPYRFSETTGIADDLLLRHWNTGPHGLKGGVPDEFIDLSPAEPDASEDGAHYLVWSTVTADPGRYDVVAGSRSAHEVWVGGASVLTGPDQGASLLPPWGIQDYRVESRSASVELAGRTPVVARFTQSSGQRLRGFVVVDPPAGERSRSPYLRWWVGPDRALSFDVSPVATGQRWTSIRFDTPPGTTAVTLSARGQVRGTDGSPFAVESSPAGAEWRHRVVLDGGAAQRDVELLVEDTPGASGATALTGPLEFATEHGILPAGWWADHGLAAYSGVVRYQTTVVLDQVDVGRWRLDLGRVAVSARVSINDVEVGTAFAPPFAFEVTSALRAGENTITVEVANTLAEFYADFPTPYADPAQLGGGLLGPVVLRAQA